MTKLDKIRRINQFLEGSAHTGTINGKYGYIDLDADPGNEIHHYLKRGSLEWDESRTKEEILEDIYNYLSEKCKAVLLGDMLKNLSRAKLGFEL